MSFVTLILGLFKGLFTLIGKALDYAKETRLVNWGKQLFQQEVTQEQIQTQEQQTEVLTQSRTKANTETRLESGTF